MRNLFLIITAIIVLVGGFLLFNKNTSQNKNPQVTATFYPLYFFASEVAGDKTQVANLTPSGVEPHDYEPTPQDVVRLQNSKIVIINGAGLEPWVDKLQNELTTKGVTIVNAAESITLLEGGYEEEHGEEQKEEHEEEIKDPHVWLNPVLAKSQVEKILEGLTKVDPNNKAYYETNAANLKSKLDELDQKYKTRLSTCQKRDFVTSHAAFGYLAKEYGLNQVSISGISPEEEPSPAELAEIAEFAKQNNVKYIFFETLVSPKLSETVAKEIGAKTMVLDPIEGLSDDDIKQGKNYFTVMEENLNNLQEALECSK